MQLYGVSPTRAARPLWLINALDLQCEVIPLNPLESRSRQRITSLNPSGKLPILVDGDLVLTESVAISLYLAEQYGDGRFIPTDVVARALMHQWLYFLVTEIEQPLWRMALHRLIYPKEERRAEEIAIAARDCRKELARVEAHLEGRETFVGDTQTVADFVAAFTLDWADEEGLLDRSPNCRAFVDRLYTQAAAPLRTSEGFASIADGKSPPNRRRDLESAA